MNGGMTVNGKIIWKYTPKQMKELFVNDINKKYFAHLCKKYMDRYVPMRVGTLKNTAKVSKDGVYYNTPYARIQYFNEDFKHTEGRTARWAEAMVKTHQKDVLHDLADYVKSNGGNP